MIDSDRAGASWDFPRSPVATRMLVDAGQAHGARPEEVLRGIARSVTDLADPEQLVEARQELAVARNLLRIVGDTPGLGMEAVRDYTLGSVGVFGFAILASSTVREALDVSMRYLALSSAFIDFSFVEIADECRIIFDDSAIPEDVRDFFVERDLAAIAQIVPLLVGADLSQIALRLELRMSGERGSALAQRFPVSEIRYDMPTNVVFVPTSLLDLPLPQADPATAQMCERACSKLLDRRQQLTGTAALVRSRLLRTQGGAATMESIARDLNVDSRTLRRHLDHEGTSYRALVAETRELLAVELLSEAGLTVAEVAARLGYADAASFSHAFIRWRGQPPSHYRRKR